MDLDRNQAISVALGAGIGGVVVIVAVVAVLHLVPTKGAIPSPPPSEAVEQPEAPARSAVPDEISLDPPSERDLRLDGYGWATMLTAQKAPVLKRLIAWRLDEKDLRFRRMSTAGRAHYLDDYLHRTGLVARVTHAYEDGRVRMETPVERAIDRLTGQDPAQDGPAP